MLKTRRASYADKLIVINILLQTFGNDPHVNWLLKDSKNKNKLEILMGYVFEETINKGEVHISECGEAVALFINNKKEKISFSYIYRNIRFLYLIGLRTVIKLLVMERLKNKFFSSGEYCYLYFVGVLHTSQRRGLATSLITPVINKNFKKNIPVYVETANPNNLELYSKIGFNIIKTIRKSGIEIFLMRI